MAMSDETKFLAGLLAGLLAFGGLIVASTAGQGPWYWAGLGVFALAVLAIFLLIRLAIDKPPDSPEGKAPPGQ